MEKLRIKNNDIYRIEVNDNGDFIEFDLADIGLRSKLIESVENLKNIENEIQEKQKNITNEKELAKLEEEMFLKMRKAMDCFLGEGACQKIFGDRNYYEMFDDLLNEFAKKRPELGGKSHFDRLKLSSNQIRQRIVDKYNKRQKAVI